MNYTELSLEELRKISINAAEKIAEKEKIDLIIYVAKAGFPIALYMNEVFQVQLLGIGAQRKGNMIKNFVGPVLAHMPRLVRDILISIELKSKVHKVDVERRVEFHAGINNLDIDSFKNILIVDDSVDTGNSAIAVLRAVRSKFSNAKIFFYSLNVWDESKKLVEVDFSTYRNTVIKSPMSKDSKEYKDFSTLYERESKHGYV